VKLTKRRHQKVHTISALKLTKRTAITSRLLHSQSPPAPLLAARRKESQSKERETERKR
jgi:hypothetical protein